MRARLVPRSTSRPASWPWPSATVVGVAGGGGLVGWGTAGAGGGGGGGGRWGRRRPGYHRLQALEPGLLLGRGGRRGRGRGRTGRGRRGGLRCRRGRWRGGGGLDAGRWGRRLIGLAPGGLDARERVGDREGAQLEARLAGGVGDLLLALVDRAAQPLVAVGRLDREVEAAVALLLFKIRVIAGADRRQRHRAYTTGNPRAAANRRGHGIRGESNAGSVYVPDVRADLQAALPHDALLLARLRPPQSSGRRPVLGAGRLRRRRLLALDGVDRSRLREVLGQGEGSDGDGPRAPSRLPPGLRPLAAVHLPPLQQPGLLPPQPPLRGDAADQRGRPQAGTSETGRTGNLTRRPRPAVAAEDALVFGLDVLDPPPLVLGECGQHLLVGGRHAFNVLPGPLRGGRQALGGAQDGRVGLALGVDRRGEAAPLLAAGVVLGGLGAGLLGRVEGRLLRGRQTAGRLGHRLGRVAGLGGALLVLLEGADTQLLGGLAGCLLLGELLLQLVLAGRLQLLPVTPVTLLAAVLLVAGRADAADVLPEALERGRAGGAGAALPGRDLEAPQGRVVHRLQAALQAAGDARVLDDVLGAAQLGEQLHPAEFVLLALGARGQGLLPAVDARDLARARLGGQAGLLGRLGLLALERAGQAGVLDLLGDLVAGLLQVLAALLVGDQVALGLLGQGEVAAGDGLLPDVL